MRRIASRRIDYRQQSNIQLRQWDAQGGERAWVGWGAAADRAIEEYLRFLLPHLVVFSDGDPRGM